MEESREAVAVLSRSENRAAVLRALASEPRDRRDLESEVGVPKSTLSRVLRELEERGWVERTDREYAATTAGSLLADRFRRLLETEQATRLLGDRLDLLPVEEMDLDVRRFHDAELVEPGGEFDPAAAFEYAVDAVAAADRQHVAVQLVPKTVVRTLYGMVGSEDSPTLRVTVGGRYFDQLDDPEITEMWATIARHGDIRRYDGAIPYNIEVLDGTVHVWLCDDGGQLHGILRSENPAVRTWAESKVDSYREDARPLSPETVA